MRGKILVVDDKKGFLDSMKLILGERFQVDTAQSGYEALEKIRSGCYDVAVVDIVLPGLLGTDLLDEIKRVSPLTEVIMITGYPSIATARYSLTRDAFDYLERPVTNEALIERIEKALRRRREKLREEEELMKLQAENDRLRSRLYTLQEQLFQIKRGNYRDMADALLKVIEIKDEYTKLHLMSVRKFTDPMSELYGFSKELRLDLEVAAELHDIGKLLISRSILHKKGPLTEEDWRHMREHPAIGAVIVGAIPEWENAAKIVLYHQERFDGKGYPEGLRGEETPLLSRIIAVTDAFHAMTSKRAYRDAMTVEEAIQELEINKGTQFDPEVVEAFMEVLERLGLKEGSKG
jgi:response regulator RpfG family c-di-GMP phosphodiesterase